MIYETWYPFDATRSPAYQLTNIAQVKSVCSVNALYRVLQINFSSIRYHQTRKL
jgi:hypothetical protein